MCRQAAIYSQLFAAFFALDFPMNLLVGRETQSLLPTAFIMLPVTANHFDRAGLRLYLIKALGDGSIGWKEFE